MSTGVQIQYADDFILNVDIDSNSQIGSCRFLFDILPSK